MEQKGGEDEDVDFRVTGHIVCLGHTVVLGLGQHKLTALFYYRSGTLVALTALVPKTEVESCLQ